MQCTSSLYAYPTIRWPYSHKILTKTAEGGMWLPWWWPRWGIQKGETLRICTAPNKQWKYPLMNAIDQHLCKTKTCWLLKVKFSKNWLTTYHVHHTASTYSKVNILGGREMAAWSLCKTSHVSVASIDALNPAKWRHTHHSIRSMTEKMFKFYSLLVA